jgi:hypothetical protein
MNINLYTILLDVTAFPFELGAVTRASSQLVATLSVLVGAALSALSDTKKKSMNTFQDIS